MKRPLIERLDKNLLDHAVAVGTKEGGPAIVDVYQLQGLSEIYYYLKVEHDFTADEVAALMQFSDPLVVTEMCWEERDPEGAFSICDLLDKIHAYEVYPLVDPADREQKQGQMITAVKAALDQNMSEYQAALLRLDKSELIAKSAEIATMQEAYSFLQDKFEFQPDAAGALLRLENPLRFVAECWPSDICGLFDMDDLMKEVIDEAAKTAASQHGEKSPAQEKAATPIHAGKPSIRGQLRDAARDTVQRQSPELWTKGGDAR